MPGACPNPPAEVVEALNEWAEISPGGNKIVLVSDRSGSQEIYISAADGSNLLQLTHFGVAHAPESPRWSPDGQQIVFDAVDQGQRRFLRFKLTAELPVVSAIHPPIT